MLAIKEISDKKTWETYINQAENYPFFQSWNWGEVQSRLGHIVERIGLFNDKALVGVCQIVYIKAKRGNYVHLRHGPVIHNHDHQVLVSLINEVKKRATGYSFVRISPLIDRDKSAVFFKNINLRDAPIHNMDAEICWVLDITKSEDELLKAMRKSHRYLIKKAQQLSIKIIKTKKSSDIDQLLVLYKDLSQRKHFVPHKGVKEELEIFSHDDEALLFLAEYQKKFISAALISFVGNTAIYRHSASDNNYRDIPASHLIQWEAIKEAKKRKKQLYNFWGIAPTAAKNHPWQGLTLFKTGFGGEKKEFTHAKDLPLSILYYKTYLIEYISKLLKGY